MEIKTILILIFIPIISALIGWFTNYLAIKSLFRPIKKVNFLFFKFQGVIPKRKNKISKNIAKVIEEYLFSQTDITKIFENKKDTKKIKERILPIIEEKVLEKIPDMFKMMAKPIIVKVLNEQIDEIILSIGKEFTEHALEDINIQQIISNKLEKYDISNIEKIIYEIADKELKHIEYLGAIIGFIVGLFQVIFVLLI